MNQVTQLKREVETLRDRLARLSEASRRINDSLDFENVLQGVLDSARSLANARYGVIVHLDEAGEIQDFLASGMSSEESQTMFEWDPGLGLAGYFARLRKPIRLSDFHQYTRALGLPEFQPPMPVNSPIPFMAAPIFTRGKIVGNFFLAEKERGEESFTTDDEEALVMFAAQAAQVIANAKRYRDEKRARARLETLIETSPFGVVVLNALTGAPVSFNLEAARIFRALRTPNRPIEQLMYVVTVRRADGREISLQEFSVAQALQTNETVRAEEIEFRVPDGRSVKTLINATPIHLEQEEEPDSFVVTLQDLTALEEIDRLRSEFSATMSHELRVPLASIKGSAATVLTSPSTFGATEMVQFFKMIDQQADHMSGLLNDLLDVAHIQAGTLSISTEPVAITEMIEHARGTFLSGGARNNLSFDIQADLPLVMADRRRIAQVLDNLLSNAARHSPDTAAINISAEHKGVHVAVTVADEGSGFAADQLPRLFRKSLRDSPDNSRGLGLSICKGIVEAHGGRIWAESEGLGKGASFTFTLPATIEESPLVAPASPPPASAARTGMGRDRIRVLVVDDDPKTLRYLRDILSKSGYEPVVTADPGEALRFVEERKPQLILLDLMLPGSSGIELMKEIFHVASVPVIFLSAYGQEDVVAKAFDMGAADYVVKPFSKTELLARIRAALRNLEVFPPSIPYTCEDLVVDYKEGAVSLAGSIVRLTPIEFRLLAQLSASAGRTLTYDQLMQHVWGQPGTLDLRPLRTAIKTLRNKLGDSATSPTYIFTEPRVGYRMPKGIPETGSSN